MCLFLRHIKSNELTILVVWNEVYFIERVGLKGSIMPEREDREPIKGK